MTDEFEAEFEATDPMALARESLGDTSETTGVSPGGADEDEAVEDGAVEDKAADADAAVESDLAEDAAAETATSPVAETAAVAPAPATPSVNGAADPARTSDGDAAVTDGAEQPKPPWKRDGKWFVVHTQSGYEKKVKKNLEARMLALDLEDKIHEIEIPMEDVIEFKNGRKVVVKKKIFPGYLLIRCENDEAVHMDIKATPGITGYAGPSGHPTPLRQREVEAFLKTPEPGEEPVRRTKPSVIYEIDESVRIKEGPFSDFQGQVIEINEEHLRVKVLVNIFGRETPVELEFSQVAKI